MQRSVNTGVTLGNVTITLTEVIGGGSGGATNLNALTDVTVVNPQAGDMVSYVNGEWVNRPVSQAVTSVVPAPAQLFLEDVQVPATPADNSALIFNSATGKWEATLLPTGVSPHALGSHVDTSTTPPQQNDVLQYDAGVWKPVAATSVVSAAGGGGTTDTKKVKVLSTDTGEGYLLEKIGAGANINFDIVDTVNGKKIEISSTGGSGGTGVTELLADSSDTVSALYLGSKLIAGTNITIDVVDLGGGNKALRFNSTGGGAVGEGPPVFSSVPAQSATVGQAYTLNLSAYVSLTNGDPILSYTLVSGSVPAGLTFNTSTGVISGTPTTATTYTATVSATDNDGASNTSIINFTVTAAAITDYDYGTFDAPGTAPDVDYGSFDAPNNTAPSLDFATI